MERNRKIASWLMRGIAAVTTITAFVVILRPVAFGGCTPTTGEYGPLAIIDWRGFVRPFGRLNFDDGGDWKIRFRRDAPSSKQVISNDRDAMNALKSVKFSCSGGDTGTPDGVFEILKGPTLIYSSGYYNTSWDYGLQNSEFGYAPVAWGDGKLFERIVRNLPDHLPAQ